MKYADLTVVENIDREVMGMVVGGINTGEWVSFLISDGGAGLPLTPSAQAAMAATGSSNFGELIQFRSNQYGYPGFNGVKARFHDAPFFADIDLPPGLTT